jgi:preprotein translocase subunit SecF
MALIRYIPVVTHFDFLRWRVICAVVSLAMLLGTVVLVVTPGLNMGVDFRGGLLMEIRTPTAANITDLRREIGALGYGELTIQSFGGPQDVLIRLQVPQGTSQDAVVNRIRAILPDNTETRRVEFVGPSVGRDLIRQGVMALLFSMAAIMVYVWFRFEWQFGVGAIVALLHDVIATVGLIALLGIEFNLTTIAAILTIAGYSINDTVVVYDRVRENLRRYRQLPLIEVMNKSLNETFSRTLLTGGTTLIALTCLYFLGGEVISGFSLAILFGVLVGTYSSLYIATPLLLLLPLRRESI